MSSHNEIFISYAWGQNREEIVDNIYNELSKDYNVTRDKVHLGYRGNIKSFMVKIGEGKAVIVVISDKYLRSKNCMFEALAIRGHGNLAKRIFPIILADANIYEVSNRIKYCNYWDKKILKLNNDIKKMNNQSFQKSIHEELNLFHDIRRFIDEFMD